MSEENRADLPDTIEGLLAYIFPKGDSSRDNIGYREAAHAKIFSILVRDNFAPALQGLSEEIAKSREQMIRSSKESAKQTKAIINTTKWYTLITGGLLIIASLPLLQSIYNFTFR